MFNGQLALDLAAHATQHAMVRAFMRATLADYGESEENSNECEHSRVTRVPRLDYAEPEGDCMGQEHQKI